ncbi:MAG: hypothetical protein RI897_4073 [Verrucomicrobiota bacterium]|jgi:hypothetical protein
MGCLELKGVGRLSIQAACFILCFGSFVFRRGDNPD